MFATLGIDFGNSTCKLAIAQKGGVDVISNEASNRQTPTIIGFGEKERAIGEAGLTQWQRNLKNTVTGVKRLIGRSWSDPMLQQEITQLPYKVVKVGENDVGIEVLAAGEKQIYSPVQVTAMMLQKLMSTAEAEIKSKCPDAVISIPAYWNDQQRRAMLDAAKIAGLSCLRLMPDNLASAVQYGIYKTDLPDTNPIYVLFVDIGERDTSVSVVQFLKGKLKVISHAFDSNLGGKNFDDVLVEHFIKEFKEKHKMEVRSNTRALARLQVASEKMKKVLNTVADAYLSIDSFMNDIDVKGYLKKTQYDEMCQSLLNRLEIPIKEALTQANITKQQLTAVETIGGGTRLTSVLKKLEEIVEMPLSQTLNREEAVARACAVQCAMLSPVFKVREFSITDIAILPVKVTIRALSGDPMVTDNDVHDLFPFGTAIPSTKVITVFKKEPFQLSIDYSKPDQLPVGTNPHIATFTIPTIPPSKEESPKIKIKVKLDLNGLVSVEGAELVETIEEVETPAAEQTTQQQQQQSTETPKPEEGAAKEEKPQEEKPKEEKPKEQPKKKQRVIKSELSLKADFTASLPEKEVARLHDIELKMVQTDKLVAETADSKNAVESYVYNMRSKLKGGPLSEFVSSVDAESFLNTLQQTEDWLYGEGEDTTKSVYVAKLVSLRMIGDPIENRYHETQNRYSTIDSVRKSIENMKLAATSADPKYDHIDAQEKSKIISEANSLEKWLNEQVQTQEKTPKTSNPVLTVAQMLSKKQEFEKMATSILNKPKPKPDPKPEPPKTDSKTSKTDSKTQQQDKTPEKEKEKENGHKSEGGDVPVSESAPKDKEVGAEMDLD